MPKNWSHVWRQILMALQWIDVAACQNMELISKILFSSHTCIAPQSLASIRESLGKIQLRCLQIDIIPSAFQKKKPGSRNAICRERVKRSPNAKPKIVDINRLAPGRQSFKWGECCKTIMSLLCHVSPMVGKRHLERFYGMLGKWMTLTLDLGDKM
ncbi:hypothetical protein AVEN_143742-1 [Araneus ventricosus]|uniref:Uncharacterized protein n=1 Tax=Araneus ventricosus TaxID=182803 RepID=A0A4Y2AQF3_ARAVE|nr:hypothetical protein AVEN_143742-1 [Araneus ventricosus]